MRPRRAGIVADGSLLPGRYHTYPELAAAGLWTTPTDLARFLIEIQKALEGRSKVLTADTARQMITVQKGSYGLGLSLEGGGTPVSFGHGGSNAGFRCAMTAFVAGGRGAVVMTNGDQGGRLGSELLRSIAAEYGWPGPRPRQKTVVPVDAAALAPLAGRYELRPGRMLTVALEGATLVVIDGPQRIELYPGIGDEVLRAGRRARGRVREGPGRRRDAHAHRRPGCREADRAMTEYPRPGI